MEVYDGDLKPVMMEGAFKAPAEIPGDFAPYGIQAIGTEIYVTYAKQDAAKHDEVKGEGLGAVVAFETSGKLIRTVAVGEKRNAPWGVALAPADFGRFSNQLLVGQFGDGSVLAFPLGANEASGGEWLEVANGRLVIDGLWGIAFGYGNANSGPKNTLYFAAGPMGETHGLFGSITLAAPSADMSASPKDY